MRNIVNDRTKKSLVSFLALVVLMGAMVVLMGATDSDKVNIGQTAKAKEATDDFSVSGDSVADDKEAGQESLETEQAVPELNPEDVENGLALAGVEAPEVDEFVDASKEIVGSVILSTVPVADYSFSFDGNLDKLTAVRRQGDDENGFNQGSYPEADSSISMQFVEGIEGNALYLDGSYGVELLGMEPLADSYTISFWFKAEQLSDWSPFLVIGSSLLESQTTQNYLSFNRKTLDGEVVLPVFNTINHVWNNSCEVRPSLENKRCIRLNEWNYITIRVDGSQVSATDNTKVMGYLYLNSEMIGCDEVSKLCLDAENLRAFLGINCYDDLFRAYYDEVHIWNSLLDENQISSMYTAYGKNAE